MYNDGKNFGELCATFRKDVLHITQEQVAEELDYSQENISAFENGRNANANILFWYLKKGLLSHYSIDELCGGNYE